MLSWQQLLPDIHQKLSSSKSSLGKHALKFGKNLFAVPKPKNLTTMNMFDIFVLKNKGLCPLVIRVLAVIKCNVYYLVRKSKRKLKT